MQKQKHLISINMNYKFHIPTQTYGFLELDGPIEEIKDAEVLYNRYAETKLNFNKNVTTMTLPSFNEDGITVEFDKDAHSYTYKGSPLTGASTIVKQFVPEFNAGMVAKNCEKSWGVPAPEIMKMWDSNKDVTGDFGTVVHAALEHYEKNRELAKKIMESRGGADNPALPKHPILKAIIEGFEEVVGKFEGKIESEILVTDIKNGRCGQVDRLLVIDEKKKICRVQDYKVNVNSEEISSNSKLKAPYDKLPANKLSKYALQLSVYAQMLENSGWDVQGIDAFVYEDTWKYYKLEKVNI